ncbi:helix-turn-helix domain-containing protein [bacterium]|nr:helix-turn-helix domain-containing protein [bacterium]
MAKVSEFSPKHRSQEVLALIRREEPGSVLARRFGVSEPTRYRWRDEFPANGKAALATRKSAGQPKARHIYERERIIGDLTIAYLVAATFAGDSQSDQLSGVVLEIPVN